MQPANLSCTNREDGKLGSGELQFCGTNDIDEVSPGRAWRLDEIVEPHEVEHTEDGLNGEGDVDEPLGTQCRHIHKLEQKTFNIEEGNRGV
jgi:hypothetical protein